LVKYGKRIRLPKIFLLYLQYEITSRKNNGYVIVDDNTGHVLDVFVMVDEDTFDNSITTSYRREGDKHFKL
jgi:hypothetical protein